MIIKLSKEEIRDAVEAYIRKELISDNTDIEANGNIKVILPREIEARVSITTTNNTKEEETNDND